MIEDPHRQSPISGGRWRERGLLHLATLTLALAWGAVVGQRLQDGANVDPLDSLLLGLFVLLMYLVHILLVLLRCTGDEALWPTIVGLTGLGLVMKYRLGFLTWDHLNEPRLYAYPLSFAGFFLAWVFFRGRRMGWLLKLYPWCALSSIALMGALLGTGERFRGALYGPHRTTPSEFLKILLVIYLAGFLAHKHAPLERTRAGFPVPPIRVVVSFLLVWMAPQILFLMQHDLGIMILFGGLLIILFYVATGKVGYVLAGAAFTGLVGYGLYTLEPADWGTRAVDSNRFLPTQELRRIHTRIQAWQDPWSDPHGRGWHTLQSLFALRAGSLDGTGLGAGSSQHIPLLESDFIYAAFAEELGLIGSGLLLLLYSFLFWRGALIAVHAGDRFRALLAIGFVSLLALQTWLNVGGVIKLIPITGITLPFLSHGGSSLLVCHIMVGLLLAISEGPRITVPGSFASVPRSAGSRHNPLP